MPFFDVVNGTTTGDQSLWNQYADGLSGAQDADVTLYAQVSPPGAPTVAVNTTAGNLTGNYQYAIAFVTGYWQGPQGSGTFHSKGNTGGGTASTTVSPNAQQVDLSNIPTGGTGVYQRIIYRTQANGTTFYYLATLADNTSTTYTDDTADSGLDAQMPTTNTTGGKFSGDASGATSIPAANLVGGPIPSSVLSDATTTTAGILESAQNPASGAPIAVITNPASQAGQSINGPLTVTDLAVAGMTGAQTQSRYVGAVSGAAPTTGTFEVGDFVLDVSNLTLWICTAAGSPGTWSNFNYLRLDANAPNPQTVANPVAFNSQINLGAGSQFYWDAYNPNIPQNVGLALTNSTILGYDALFLNGAIFATTGALYVGASAASGSKSISLGDNSGSAASVDNSGNATFAGTVTASSGQLGSASGAWTPASGSLNVAVGTVINIASVPTGAKMCSVIGVASTDPLSYYGSTSAAQAVWSVNGNTQGYSNGISSTTTYGGALASIYDGSYSASGYFQINNGYLQFVVVTSTSSTVQQINYRWAVS